MNLKEKKTSLNFFFDFSPNYFNDLIYTEMIKFTCLSSVLFLLNKVSIFDFFSRFFTEFFQRFN